MPDTIPAAHLKSLVTPELVRLYIFDRSASDNPLELDLFWSEEEILNAMGFTAMKYNDIQPPVHYVDAMSLPYQGLFLDGVCYHLFLATVLKLGRNDLEYTAGNMSVDINKRRIEFLTKWAGIFKEEFEIKAQNQKRMINIDAAFGQVG